MTTAATATESELLALLSRVFASGYHRGHNDTVEGQFTDVLESDAASYFESEVADFLPAPNTKDDPNHFAAYVQCAESRDAALARVSKLEAALGEIAKLGEIWNSNKMGSISVHRSRWNTMAGKAARALLANEGGGK